MLCYNLPNIIPVNTVMNTTINSVAIQLQNIVDFSIQIVFTGTPTGSFKLQMSDEPVPKENLIVQANGIILYTVVNWTDIANSTFAVTAAGNVAWDYNNCGFTYVRAVYTDTSGGVSTAIITASDYNGKGA
jgi:hypothetical protein